MVITLCALSHPGLWFEASGSLNVTPIHLATEPWGLGIDDLVGGIESESYLLFCDSLCLIFES